MHEWNQSFFFKIVDKVRPLLLLQLSQFVMLFCLNIVLFAVAAPPVYYAHKLAFRARFYLTQVPVAGGDPGAAKFQWVLPEIKEEVKKSMLFCQSSLCPPETEAWSQPASSGNALNNQTWKNKHLPRLPFVSMWHGGWHPEKDIVMFVWFLNDIEVYLRCYYLSTLDVLFCYV